MIADVRSRTPGPPHAHVLLTGRRLLAVANGQVRTMEATGPAGTRAAWSEDGRTNPGELITWRRLDPRTGYLHIALWTDPDAVEQGCEAALTDLRGCERLVLDLRGNVGGNLMLASCGCCRSGTSASARHSPTTGPATASKGTAYRSTSSPR